MVRGGWITRGALIPYASPCPSLRCDFILVLLTSAVAYNVVFWTVPAVHNNRYACFVLHILIRTLIIYIYLFGEPNREDVARALHPFLLNAVIDFIFLTFIPA